MSLSAVTCIKSDLPYTAKTGATMHEIKSFPIPFETKIIWQYIFFTKYWFDFDFVH